MEQKIPEVLQDAAGAVITDRKVWEQQRGRIYELLCDQEYGFLPPPPEQISFRTVERQEDFCASKAVYERVEIRVQVSGTFFIKNIGRLFVKIELFNFIDIVFSIVNR